MSPEDHGRVQIRSYRVVFRLERRIFQIDRFRLPFPYGVEVRALVYAAAVYAVVFLTSRLPVAGTLVGVFPAPVHWGLGPLGVVFAMVKLRIDGRPPHCVLTSMIRWVTRSKQLAGLRPCPAVGLSFTPMRDLWMRPDWRAEHYRRALIIGPAKVTLRYPATVEVRSALRQRLRRSSRADDPHAITARRLLISADSEKPMFVGKTIDIPVGGEVKFQ